MRQITVYTIDELTEIDHLNLSEKHAECVVFCSTVNAIAHALDFCNIFDYAVENGFLTLPALKGRGFLLHRGMPHKSRAFAWSYSLSTG